jgi:hypothetical protein
MKLNTISLPTNLVGMHLSWVPNDVLNMSPILQTVPQDVPNNNMVYPTIFAQSFTFITYEGVPEGSTSLYYYFGGLPNVSRIFFWFANQSVSLSKKQRKNITPLSPPPPPIMINTINKYMPT